MSRITLQNTNLDFNVTIVALDEKEQKGDSLSIDIGAISNFEIDDNLIDFGITGTITYANWFQIIDKLGVTAARKKTVMYIIVDIQSLEEADEEKRKVSFVGLMSPSSDSGGNIATTKQTYRFEEASTARLKELSFTSLKDPMSRGEIPELIVSLLEKSRTPYDRKSFDEIYLPEVGPPSSAARAARRPFEDNPFGRGGLAYGLVDLSLLDSLTLPFTVPREILTARRELEAGLERAPIFPNQTSDLRGVDITDFMKKDESLYAIINNLYNALRQGDDLPLLKVETVKLKGKDGEEYTEERQLQYRDILSDRHKEFIQEYTSGRDSGRLDYSDVYQEEFLIGPEERETLNTSPYNKVEEYRHIKPDLGQLRKNIWGAYKINGHRGPDLSNFGTDIINFNLFIAAFEGIINHPCNIPRFGNDTDPIQQKVFEQEAISSSINATEIIQSIVYNRVFKSFIFRNEAIVLRVKGQIYRKPGVFITIRGSLNTQGKPQTDLWLVIRNKHIFNNGLYENEITAVRFLGESTRENPVDFLPTYNPNDFPPGEDPSPPQQPQPPVLL